MQACDEEFLAQEELIEITPNFTYSEEMKLICGNYGPIQAGEKTVVPLWLALHLKSMHKCRIHQPDWLTAQNMKALASQQRDTTTFIEVPQHYLAFTKILVDKAYDDIIDVDELRLSVKDLWDYRDSRLRDSVDTFVRSGAAHAKVNNLTSLEICSLRNCLTSSLDHLRQMQATAAQGDSSSNDNTSNSFSNSLSFR